MADAVPSSPAAGTDPPSAAPASDDPAHRVFDAFISYRRLDGRPLAVWLRDRLQRFRIPQEVLDKLPPAARELHARRLRIFLDTAYEKPSPDFLNKKVYPALDASRRLIVVSTPSAFVPVRDRAGSETANWLWLEIERFLGGTPADDPSRPIDVIIGPGAPVDRFPGRLNENARWDWIDLRNFTRWRAYGFGEDLDIALIKLVAACYDVPDQLLPALRREERRRRTRLLVLAAAGAGTIAAAMSVLALFALNRQVQANRAAALSQEYLVASRRQLADALATAAGTARVAGDGLTAARLLTEARRTAATPLVMAHTLAARPPRAAFERTLVDSGDQGAWAFAFRPRSPQIAIGRYDGSVRLFDRAGAERHVLLADGDLPVIDLAFTEDGRRLAVLRRRTPDGAWNTWPGTPPASDIHLLDLSTAGTVDKVRKLAPAAGEPHFLSLAVSGTHDALLVGTDRDVRLARLDGGDWTILTDQTSQRRQGASVALSFDKAYAAASTIRGEIRVWNLQTLNQRASFAVAAPSGSFEYNPFRLHFSPVGHTLAFGSFDGMVHLWNVAAEAQPGRRLRLHRSAVTSVAWSHDGAELATGSYDGASALVEAESGQATLRLPTSGPGLTAGVMRLQFTPESTGLAVNEAVPAAGGARSGGWLFGALRLWSLTRRNAVPGQLHGVAFDNDAKLVTWSTGDRLTVVTEGSAMTSACGAGRTWSPISEAQQRRRTVPYLGASRAETVVASQRVEMPAGPEGTQLVGPGALAPSGRQLALLTGRATQDGAAIRDVRLRICDAGTGRELHAIALPVDFAASLGPVAFNHSGTRLVASIGRKHEEASGTAESHIYVVDPQSASTRRAAIWANAVASLVLDPTGRYAALSDAQGEMAVLDIGSGTFRALPRYLSGTTFQLAFDPRGRMLVAASQAQLRLFDLSGDLAPNERRASVPLRFRPSVIDITPDGRLLAVGEEHGELSFWELASLTELVRVAAHEGPVLALRTSPDGSRLASVGLDGLHVRGGFVPASSDFAERLTRLALVGSTPRPLGRDQEQRHTDRWPTARWETAGDAAAAAFWQVMTAGGIRHVRPQSWWQWLFWRSSTEETRALAEWRQKHPDHPLTGVAETFAE